MTPTLQALAAALTATFASFAPLASAAPAPTPNDQMAAVLRAQAKLHPKPIETLSAPEARRQPSPADGVLQLLQDKGDASPKKLPPVGKVGMKAISSDGVQIPIRIYTPPGDAPAGGWPAVVYFHGGGWVLATIDTYDASARSLCALAKAVVIAPEYRKAPEYKFPAAHEDCYATLQYVASNPSDFNIDPSKIAVAGESAGGNMATAVCLMAHDRNGHMPIHQLLIYPVTQTSTDSPSYETNADAKPLNKSMMLWFFDKYEASPADAQNKYLAPLTASDEDLRALPPATVITAEIDPLHDDGKMYADKLKSAGVSTTYMNYPGVTHEFFGMALLVDQAKAAETFATTQLKTAFTHPEAFPSPKSASDTQPAPSSEAPTLHGGGLRASP